MWIALALPSLHLLAGLGGTADASVSISLQSALLGIDEHSALASGQLSPALLRARRTRDVALAVPLNARLRSLSESPSRDGGGSTVAQAPPLTPVASTPSNTQTPQPQPAEPIVAPPAAAPTVPKMHHVPAPAAPPTPTVPPVSPPTPPEPVAQGIYFTSAPPGNLVAGGPAYTLSARADSGLPVAFTADASSSGICDVVGSSVLPIGAGTCFVDAEQAGNARYKPAPRVQQSFPVGDGTPSVSVQSISFLSTPPAGVVVGGGTYQLDARASSGLPVSYSTSPGSHDVCTIASDAVRFTGAGTCRIFADQHGDAFYSAAPQEQQVFTVALVPQTIAFTSTPPTAATVGDPPYIVSAVAASGLPVVFSADPSSAAVCTVTGSSVVAVGAGTCLIDADQFGDLTHAAAEVQQSFAVNGAAPSRSVQSILFSSVPPASAAVAGTPYTVAATASSGLAVAFSVTASSAGVCSIAGASVSFLGVGTCTVTADQPGDTSYLSAAQVRQAFPVTLDPQAVSFTSIPPVNALVGGPAYTVSASASSGLAVTYSLGAGSAGVCALTGASVSFVGAGTCTIDADQAGNSTYQRATQVQQSFAVATPSLSVQSISFTTAAPAGATIGGSSYAVSATASSGLVVAFAIDATSATTCAISGTTVTFTGTGTCTIDANQAGDASYQPAPQSQQTFAVGLHGQTISFSSTPPAGVVVGGSAYTVAASASSGLPVAYTSNLSTAGVCTVTGTTVAFVGVGTCTIDADQTGDSTYAPAPRAQQSFAVSAPSSSPQTIAFTSTPPASASVGGASYIATASASSGLAVTFRVDAATSTVCSIAGATVTFIATGSCTIDANQAGDASYEAAPQVQQTVSVGLAPQAISFGSTAPAGALVGDPDYTVSAIASSGLPVAFSADASSAGICTVSGTAVSLVGSGICTIDAAQSGDSTYGAAPQAQQSFGVGVPATLSVQSIAFTSTPPPSTTVGGSTYTVGAIASSGLSVVFTVDASSTGICTVSGATVTSIAVGTCTIDANQAGDANYQPAPQAQQSFAIGLDAQTISFASPPPAAATVGGTTYTVTAAASSGLPVTLTVDATSSGVCSIAGSAVAFIAAGTCTIDANQSGNATFKPASQVQQSFAVSAPSASPQTITFTSTPPASAAIGGPTYTVSAVASSGLAVALTIDASSASVCTMSGGVVSFTGTGTCRVDANQAGDGSYQAAPQVQQSIAVGLKSQTISFTSTPPGGATVGGSTYSVGATAGSGLTVTFTIAAASSGVCSLSGSTVSFTASGTCTIDANQAGNGTYAAAPQGQQSFTVSAPSLSAQTINFTTSAPSGAVVGGTAYQVGATASSGLAVTFTIAAASSGVCTISGTTVSFVGAGTCTIKANQTGSGSYQAAPEAQQSFTVSLRPQTIFFVSGAPGSAVVGGSTYTVFAFATSFLPVSFSIAPGSASVCSISGSTVSMIGVGTCVINANQAGNGTYRAATTVQQSFAVGKGSQTITFTSTAPSVDKADPPYTVTATSSSGLPVVFSLDPSSAGICTLSGSVVSFVGRGNCIVYANQAGDANWLAAPQVEQSIAVKNHTPG
jgi:hypothetical protein